MNVNIPNIEELLISEMDYIKKLEVRLEILTNGDITNGDEVYLMENLVTEIGKGRELLSKYKEDIRLIKLNQLL